MICTFFGHKNTPDEIEPILRQTILDLIKNKNTTLFYVGNHGNFDFIVRKILTELSKYYSIKFFVVLAYLPNRENNLENTIFPDGIENVPLKFAINFRNEWMIKKSDFVVTYVRYIIGGAYKFKELAEKKNKTVINLVIP